MNVQHWTPMLVGLTVCLMLLAPRTGWALKTEVRMDQGAPTIFVDGQAQTPLFVLTQPSTEPGTHFLSQARMASAAGLHLFACSLPLPWPKPGETADYSGVDKVLSTLIAVNPQALVIPRFDVEPPHWWLDAHPSEEMKWSDSPATGPQTINRMAAVSSEPWLAEATSRTQALVRYCEEHWGDHILGYHPCGQQTAEWFYERAWEPVPSGFDKASRAAFAAWVRGKYQGDTAALRRAWAQPEATFDAIRVPAPEERTQARRGFFRDPASEGWLIDYQTWQQEAMVSAVERFTRAIKEACGGQKLVSVYYGYSFELINAACGPAASGHFALTRLLRDPNLDMVCSPISYVDRGSGGSGQLMVPVDSVRAAGKLYLLEDDTRTWLANRNTPMGVVSPTDNLAQTVGVHRRNTNRLITRRMATWYMDLEGDGWLDHQGIWDNVRAIRAFYDAQRAYPLSFTPEAAVVVDDRAAAVMVGRATPATAFVERFRQAIYRLGAPCAYYLMSDVLAGRVELPKMTVFLGCWRLSATERQALKQKLEGKTAVWTYGCGYLGEAGADAAFMGDLTGLRFTEATSGTATARWIGKTLAPEHDGQTIGQDRETLTPRWTVEPGAGITPLAEFAAGGGLAAAAREDGHGGRAIVIGTTDAPAWLLHAVAQAAGVHRWVETDDVVEADAHMLSISVAAPGERAIHVPAGRILQREDGTTLQPAQPDGTVRETFQAGETKTYLIGDKTQEAAKP